MAQVGHTQMQASLVNHDRIRWSTDLPFFFGRKDKDKITARLLINRNKTTAETANWHKQWRCQELYMVLRDQAIIWWIPLPDTNVNRDDWPSLRANFLACYKPKFMGKITCTNFGELVQRSRETNFDYYLQVCDAFARM